jgi:hypothetical protein
MRPMLTLQKNVWSENIPLHQKLLTHSFSHTCLSLPMCPYRSAGGWASGQCPPGRSLCKTGLQPARYCLQQMYKVLLPDALILAPNKWHHCEFGDNNKAYISIYHEALQHPYLERLGCAYHRLTLHSSQRAATITCKDCLTQRLLMGKNYNW